MEENEAVRYRLSSMTKSNFSFWILVVGVVLCSCAKNESVPSPLNSPFGKWDIYSIQYNDEKVFDEMVIYESQLLESQGLKVKSYLEITKKEFKTVTECTVIGGPTIKAESYYKDFKFEDSLAFFNNDIETVKIPLTFKDSTWFCKTINVFPSNSKEYSYNSGYFMDSYSPWPYEPTSSSSVVGLTVESENMLALQLANGIIKMKRLAD